MNIANGELLLGKKGEYSTAIPAEQLRDADPEYLIVAPCGFPLERAQRELAVLERHAWWPDLQAVRKSNVVFADGNLYFNRSGMTIARTAEIIAEILHGVSFGYDAAREYTQIAQPWLPPLVPILPRAASYVSAFSARPSGGSPGRASPPRSAPARWPEPPWID